MMQLLVNEMYLQLILQCIYDILDFHGHFEHQLGKVAFRNYASHLEVLLCITIPIGITNGPGDLSLLKRKNP